MPFSNRTLSLPDALAAVAITAVHDPDLVDGVHLRVMPSPAIGFPLAPLAIYRVTPFLAEPTVTWWDERGELIDGGDVDAAGGTLTAALDPPPDGAVDVAVEVVPDGGFEGTISLLDSSGHRVLTSVSEQPYVLAAPFIKQVRITGRGRIGAVRAWRVTGRLVCGQIIGTEPLDLMGLPIDGDRPWYTGGLGKNRALDLVKRAAPKRLTPPDQPDGPLDQVSPEDEVLRVQDQAVVLLADCEQMLDDPSVRPAERRAVQDQPAVDGRPRQIVDLALSSTLLLRGMDPGAGRYLGLVGQLDEHPDWTEPAAYAVAGLFAIDPDERFADGRPLADQLGPSAPLADLVTTGLAARLGAEGLVADIHARGLGVQVRGLAAVAATVRPPDRPALPAVQAGRSHWLDGDGDASTAFQQALTVPGAPLGALVALARQEAGAWVSRHRTVDLPGPATPARRAVPMLLGRTATRSPSVGDGLVSDAPVPAGNGGTGYRLALADLFGRFGPGVDAVVRDPDRPRPPQPVVQIRVEPHEPPGATPASPGVLLVEVPVPSIAGLAAGSMPIAAVELAVDGHAVAPLAVPAPGQAATIQTTVDLPPLALGDTGRVTLTVRLTDTVGASSDPADVSAAFADQRRPTVVPTGPGLIWTSRPGPAPEVELALQWPGRDGHRYRVYMADGPGLGLTGTERARVAVDGYRRDQAGQLGNRDRFRLLTEPPLTPRADGVVTFAEPLPRSLEAVQFLRVISLTAAGREAEFDSCGVIAVAVPTDRRPPAPALHVLIDPATGSATATVDAVGLDLDALATAEPGLFAEPPNPAAHPPEVRLRRAAGPIADPVYAKEVGRWPLVVHRDGNSSVTMLAEVNDPRPLIPFVRYSYWAEIRLPAERRLAPEVVEVLPPDGIRPAGDEQITDMVRPFSAASAAATVLAVPVGPPPELTDPAVTRSVAAGQATTRLHAAAAPVTHPLAIGSYRLQIWEQWDDGPIDFAAELTLTPGPLDWTGQPRTDDGSAVVLHVRMVDPIGRAGPLSRLTSA